MSTQRDLVWEYRIPLLTNRWILWDMIRVVAISAGAIGLILTVAGLPLSTTVQFVGIIGGIFTVLIIVAMLILGNGVDAFWSITESGVGYESGKTAKKWNRAAVVLGTLAGKPGVAGSGLLATANESGTYTWSEIEKATLHEGEHIISIHNNWRTLLRIYMTPEVYRLAVPIFEEKLGTSRIRRI